MTPSNVVGLKGLRRHRVAPSLTAILRKSGLDASKIEKAEPEIAINGTVGACS